MEPLIKQLIEDYPILGKITENINYWKITENENGIVLDLPYQEIHIDIETNFDISSIPFFYKNILIFPSIQKYFPKDLNQPNYNSNINKWY